jgi:hypothetical protein
MIIVVFIFPLFKSRGILPPEDIIPIAIGTNYSISICYSMINSFILKTMLFPALFFTSSFANAQAKPLRNGTENIAIVNKPFKIITSGKQITIQSKQLIKSVLAWTANGHRIVEQKELNSSSYTFTIPQKEKIAFLLIEFADQKRFTEKIGVN